MNTFSSCSRSNFARDFYDDSQSVAPADMQFVHKLGFAEGMPFQMRRIARELPVEN